MDHLPSLDDDGHLKDHTDWTPEVAQRLADTLGVTLESEHYQIINEVRVFFETYHHSPSTRPLIKHLMLSLPSLDISNQKLQQLFKTGLVARHVNRIAGLPKPPNCL
ncbi:TusE/DsrC/DsvC family sulfur relay protein [Moraxella canis]|uniref:TusE/DsrC/DsvC family sulfur relay protein n=1 Tax=Moraxella canis TaxID=90239 RepID=UPI000664FA80|nr:TusE/DsrC/DsvC family sulfur relay protein [Moraxella canis]